MMQDNDQGYYDRLIASCIRAFNVPKSMTLGDLERPKRTLAEIEKNTEPTI